ncbi:MAG TPA: helix-turn-helix domain-containing protein [Chloroflexia bacterium]|nr:helix-turn-helix domain-containing protein [Chloroflexia bacterium]
MDKLVRRRNLEDCPSVMTVDQLIEVVPLGRSLIYDKLRSGEIPARRVGKRYLILRDQVINWLQDTKNG